MNIDFDDYVPGEVGFYADDHVYHPEKGIVGIIDEIVDDCARVHWDNGSVSYIHRDNADQLEHV